MTADEFAAAPETTVAVDEAVSRGWISEAEQRLYEGRATRDDLEHFGYPPEEMPAMHARG